MLSVVSVRPGLENRETQGTPRSMEKKAWEMSGLEPGPPIIAQFCLLSAVGSSARSRIRYVRVMGMKEDNVRSIGFRRLAIFRPGIIAGNAHTPAWSAWLGRLLPGGFGNIDQQILGRSIAAEIALHCEQSGEVMLENAAMKKLAAEVTP